MRFIFLTRTNWNEPPRIRHQLAELLVSEGHDVVFFQKPVARASLQDTSVKSSLTLSRYRSYVHHQLKFLTPLRWIDDWHVRTQLRARIAKLNVDAVVNFNYDYPFLRALFPNTPLIHLINDDFVGSANALHRPTAERLQTATSASSDYTLCVSHQLLAEARKATPDSALFLPWARREYRRPPTNPARDELLYWGYINERINFCDVTALLDSGVRINFVGQVSDDARIATMLEHANATYQPPRPLAELADVVNRCSASILPYDLEFEPNLAISMSNRGFELLSWGLPLLFSNLPHLIDAPPGVLYKCMSVDDYRAAHAQAVRQFESMQDTISAFLDDHYAESRYRQLMKILEQGAGRPSAPGSVGGG